MRKMNKKTIGKLVIVGCLLSALCLLMGGQPPNPPDGVIPVYYLAAVDTPGSFRRGGSNVKVCDGTADNIQAQAWATKIGTDGFGTIEFMPGNYVFAATVLLDDNTLATAARAGTVKITLAAKTNNPIFINTEYTEGGAANANITIRNIKFDGNRANQVPASVSIYDNVGNVGLIGFNEITNARIENCEVVNAAWAGICVAEGTDVWILNNKIDNCNDDAIGINDSCTRVVVSGNHMTDVGKSGDYGGPAGVEIQDGSSFVTVTNNHIACATTTNDKFRPAGITLESHTGSTAPHHVVISGNTIQDAYGASIKTDGNDAAQWPYNIVISGNVLDLQSVVATHVAIQILKIRRATIRGNVIYKNDSTAACVGLSMSEVEDTVIVDNVFYVLTGGTATGDSGVFVGRNNGRNVNLDRVRITGNTFTNFDYCVFYIDDGDGTADWDNVVIADNVMASPDVVTSNTAMWNDTAPATYTNCVWQNNLQEEAVTREHYIYAGSVFGDANWQIESSGRSEKGISGGFVRRRSEASATLTGGTTTIQVNVPIGARLIGAQLIVDTAITAVTGVSWSAEWNDGASLQSIAAAQAFTKSTKAQSAHDDNANTPIVDTETDIVITPNAGTFSAGVIRAIAYYEQFVTQEAAQ